MTKQEEFRSAVENNDLKKVKSILNDKYISPQELDNYSICVASVSS